MSVSRNVRAHHWRTAFPPPALADLGESSGQDSLLLQELAVVEGGMVADTLGNVAGKDIAADTDMVADTGTEFGAENESGGVKC